MATKHGPSTAEKSGKVDSFYCAKKKNTKVKEVDCTKKWYVHLFVRYSVLRYAVKFSWRVISLSFLPLSNSIV